MTSRLVVVSNRVPDGHASAAGGLAVALLDALRDHGGVWLGWSGHVVDSDIDAPRLRHSRQANIRRVTFDLDRRTHEGYYCGYSNGALWPVLHGRVDLARFDPGQWEHYRRANRWFAHALMHMLGEQDLVWIHDYHLLLVAQELRSLRSRHRIGLFLHTPLPAPDALAALPGHQRLLGALFDFDLVGLQTRGDMLRLADYLQGELGAQRDGDDAFVHRGRRLRVQAFPIGIDAEAFRDLLREREAQDIQGLLRRQYARRELLVAVDRMDYSKGIPQRLRALRELYSRHPEDRGRATLIQIAVPGREGVQAYRELAGEVERLSGALNGDFGELEWIPLRLLRRALSRRRLAGLFHASKAALVTPLRDGMNLVAKEYLAAQDREDPGVLILSRFAGAAEQLGGAVLVNPYDVEGVAEAIHQALHMSREQRCERHRDLVACVEQQDARWWSRRFVAALRGCKPGLQE